MRRENRPAVAGTAHIRKGIMIWFEIEILLVAGGWIALDGNRYASLEAAELALHQVRTIAPAEWTFRIVRKG